MTEIQNLLQLGFAGAIATYLVYFICNRVIRALDEIMKCQSKILAALDKMGG